MLHRPRGRVGLLVVVGLLGVALLLFTLPSPAQSLAPTRQASQVTLPASGVVSAEGALLRVRNEPSVDGVILARIEPGSTIQVLEISADGEWYRIQFGGAGVQAWVAAEFVALGDGSAASTSEESKSEESAPEISALLPTPTPAPTREADANEASSATGAIPGLVPPLRVTPVEETVVATETVAASEPVSSTDVTSTDVTSTDVTTQSAAAIPVVSALQEAPGAAAMESVSATTTLSETEAATSTASAQTVASAQATPTPVPTPSVATAVTVPANMNVRRGPSTNYTVMVSVPAGTSLVILALSPGGDWYQVELDEGDDPGYVYAPLTTALGPVANVRRLNPDELPPEPTPAPAPVIAVSAAATGGSGSFPASPGFFGYGVQAHMLGGETGRAMDAVSDMGFNWVKQQVEWRLFQPQPGAAGFGDVYGIVAQAQARNINVLVSVVNAPFWAREPGFNGDVGGPPADVQTYANYVGAMAGQFCGSALKAIEVWNEENLHYEWGNLPLDPASYMQLLRAAYVSIKSACPGMLVISGAPTPAGSNPPFAVDDFAYLEGMYQNGLAANSDGIGAHPSGYNVPASVTWENACAAIQQFGNSFNGACDNPHHSWSFRSTMEGYRNIMVVYGDANKRIWPTEFGWAAGGAFDARYAYANDNSFDEQAAWTVEAYQMMKGWGWVGPAFLWNLNFRVVADGTEKAQWGIVRNDWSPLPVYDALPRHAEVITMRHPNHVASIDGHITGRKSMSRSRPPERLILLIALAALLALGGCGRGRSEATPTPTKTPDGAAPAPSVGGAGGSGTGASSASTPAPAVPQPAGGAAAAPSDPPTPATRTVAVINADLLNVRSAPNTSGEVRQTVAQGERYDIIGRSQDGQWIQIGSGGRELGWVAAEFVVESTETGGAQQAGGGGSQPANTPAPVAAATPVPQVGSGNYQPATMRSPDFGGQAFLWWRPEIASRDLTLMQEAGFEWVKQAFAWETIERAGKGQFDWSVADRVVRDVNNHNLKLLARLSSDPDLANFWAGHPPGNADNFADFAFALASRYNCSPQAVGCIQAYQVWNEPNLAREWGGNRPNPAQYAEFLRKAYAAIKHGNPNAIVISAGMAPTGDNNEIAMPDDIFYDSMYQAMGGNSSGYFDMLGVHGAGFAAPPELDPATAASDPRYGGYRFFSFRHVEDIHAIMVRYGDTNKKVVLLEFGWTFDSVNASYKWHGADAGITDMVQGDYLKRAYEYATANWQPWIGLMSLLTMPNLDWMDDGNPRDEEQYWWAILEPSPIDQLYLRPAYVILCIYFNQAKGQPCKYNPNP